MRAYSIESFGSVDGVVLGSRDDPRPGTREILVRVRATSLNYRDLMVLKAAAAVYLRQHQRIDAEIAPIDELARYIISLYSISIIDLLENEGHLYEVFSQDLDAALGMRYFKVQDRVWNEVEGYRNLNRAEDDGSLVNVKSELNDTKESEGIQRRRPWNGVLEVSAGASLMKSRQRIAARSLNITPIG